ncbi:hypothetical protein ACMATS_05865 [Streptoverticillium reticulum]|uniref:hypothetical protein n=1 Tax=Streptoverticillium reticulum TaxID=1433415 RepID=UPI0039BF84F4
MSGKSVRSHLFMDTVAIAATGMIFDTISVLRTGHTMAWPEYGRVLLAAAGGAVICEAAWWWRRRKQHRQQQETAEGTEVQAEPDEAPGPATG